MARYIDIDKYSKWIDNIDINKPCVIANVNGNDINCYDAGCAECYYNNGGAEDIAPVVHAKWVELENAGYLDARMVCSNCGNVSTPLGNWKCCPICEAKMDKE